MVVAWHQSQCVCVCWWEQAMYKNVWLRPITRFVKQRTGLLCLGFTIRSNVAAFEAEHWWCSANHTLVKLQIWQVNMMIEPIKIQVHIRWKEDQHTTQRARCTISHHSHSLGVCMSHSELPSVAVTLLPESLRATATFLDRQAQQTLYLLLLVVIFWECSYQLLPYAVHVSWMPLSLLVSTKVEIGSIPSRESVPG